MNQPYVMQFNETGILINPINGAYISSGLNRKQRRDHLQKDRFCGNSKNYHLTIVKTAKFKRVKQYVRDLATDKIKVIEHYLK